MEVAMKTNQETAARLIHEQNQEWQQLARGRHDIKQISEQLKQPNQRILLRVMEDQKKDFTSRAEKAKLPAKKDVQMTGRKDFQKKGRPQYNWKQGSSSSVPYYKRTDGAQDRESRFKKRQREEKPSDKGRDSPKYRSRPERSRSRKKQKTKDDESK